MPATHSDGPFSSRWARVANFPEPGSAPPAVDFPIKRAGGQYGCDR